MLHPCQVKRGKGRQIVIGWVSSPLSGNLEAKMYLEVYIEKRSAGFTENP